MSVETNIKINYMILEQILKVTGTYRIVCKEYKYLHGLKLNIIFKYAKEGQFDSLFPDDTSRDNALEMIENITGVSTKYWSGEERIKLNMRYKKYESKKTGMDLNIIKGESIDEIETIDDKYNTAKTGNISNNDYARFVKNPLNLDYRKIFLRVHNKESLIYIKKDSKGLARPYIKYGEELSKIELAEGVKVIQTLYSLEGLIKVLLINMSTVIGDIEFNINQRSKWQPYIRLSKTATTKSGLSTSKTQEGIGYCPKFIEIRKGQEEVRTIIKNVVNRFMSTRDLRKKFEI